MPMTDEQIKALRDGCENVTPGPWWWHPPTETDNDTCEIVCDIFGDEMSIADYANEINAAHIARCDPQTIAELCARALEAEATVRELETEGAQLAANQCHDGYGDEWGNHRCRVQDALQARVKALEDALARIKRMVPKHPAGEIAQQALEEAPKALL